MSIRLYKRFERYQDILIFKIDRKCLDCSPLRYSVLLIVLEICFSDRFTDEDPNHVTHRVIPMSGKIDQPFLADPEGLLEKLLE